MTHINRAAWKRIKERVAQPKVTGGFYHGTIKSMIIDGVELPVMESEVFEFRSGNRLAVSGKGKR